MANIPISSFTAAANATGIGMSGFSLTGSNAQSMLDLAGTWNTSGTPSAININVTDTASNAASLLMNLRVGGVSQFSVTKGGFGLFSNSIGIGTGVASGANAGLFTISGANNAYISLGNAGHFRFVGASSTDIFSLIFNGPAAHLPSNGQLGWTNSANTQGTADLYLARDTANTLAQRNGVNAQTLRVYSTFTDASNYTRGFMRFAGNIFEIGSEAAGTGTASAVRIYTGAASGTFTWAYSSSGHYVAGADNTYDIGASGASRPRFLYLAGGSLTGTQADSSLSITPTWNTTGTPSAIDLNVTDTASNAASLLMNLRVGGVSQFNVGKSGVVTVYGNVSPSAGNSWTLGNVGAGLEFLSVSARSVQVGTSGGFASLTFDAADILAQRRGTNAQTFRVYNTYTDASNYERGVFRYSGNILQIGHEAAGTGTSNRTIQFQTAGFNPLTLDTATATFNVNLALSTASILSMLNISNQTGFTQMQEMTAPAAPAADRVRIYAEDNGSGKTRLMARFATGAAVQIAIEP